MAAAVDQQAGSPVDSTDGYKGFCFPWVNPTQLSVQEAVEVTHPKSTQTTSSRGVCDWEVRVFAQNGWLMPSFLM